MKDFAIQLIQDSNDGDIGDVVVVPKRDALGKIVSGIVIGNTLPQNQAMILIANEGDIKEYPFIGVGFNDVLLGEELLEYRHKIRKHFAMDGLNIKVLELYDLKKFKLEASYGNS